MHNVIKKYFNVAADFLFSDQAPPDAKAWRYRLLVPVGLLLTVQIAWYPLRAMKDILWMRFPDIAGELRALSLVEIPVVAFICGLIILSLVFWQDNPPVRRVRLTMLFTGGAIALASLYSGYSVSGGETIGRLGYYILPVLDVAWPFIVAGFLVSFDTKLRGNLGSVVSVARLRLTYFILVFCWCSTIIAAIVILAPYYFHAGMWSVAGALSASLMSSILHFLVIGACALGGFRALSGDTDGIRKSGRRTLELFTVYSVWVLLVDPLYTTLYSMITFSTGTPNPIMQFLRATSSGVASGVSQILYLVVLTCAAWLVIAGISLWKSEEDGKA